MAVSDSQLSFKDALFANIKPPIPTLSKTQELDPLSQLQTSSFQSYPPADQHYQKITQAGSRKEILVSFPPSLCKTIDDPWKNAIIIRTTRYQMDFSYIKNRLIKL
ncbi:uncharacterized protein G2W53_026301 [Senna tora]|uniref:Uncharacterized protein n=1 Tax=Senna tora TaxID=362788 RepID=A0A834TGQ7_9FABA|nr:uncharacterized protein G2W53_026301 [Senna tora]